MSRLLAVLLLVSSAMAQIPLGGITVSPSGGGSPSITFIQDCHGLSDGITTYTMNCPVNATTGDVILVPIASWNTGNVVTSVKMNDGGSGVACTQDYYRPVSSTVGEVYFYRCVVPSSSITGVSVVFNGNTFAGVSAVQYRGSATFVKDACGDSDKIVGTSWGTVSLSITPSKYELIAAGTLQYSNNADYPGPGTWGNATVAKNGAGGTFGTTGQTYQINTSTSSSTTPTGPLGGGGDNSITVYCAYKVN